MALDSYTNLKAYLREHSKRKDVTDLQLDDFILITEEEMFANDQQPLQMVGIDTRATAALSTTTRYLALPDGYIDMRRLRVNLETDATKPDNWRDIKFRSPDQLPTYTEVMVPQFFTVTSQLEFDSVSDQAYTLEMQYYKKPTALSSSNASNVVLSSYPTIYSFGCLWALWNFFKEEELATYYYQLFINALSGANRLERNKRYGSAPIIRIEGHTP